MAGAGAIGCVPVKGPGGLGIAVGEFILDRHADAQHAFVLLDDDTLLEAEPDGARIMPLSEYDGVRIDWIDPPLSDVARAEIVRVARTKVGMGYNWWAYVWLALCRLGFRPRWVRRRVDNPKNAMCSQLADLIWREASANISDPFDRAMMHLFEDTRDPGNVTPGDLDVIARRQATK